MSATRQRVRHAPSPKKKGSANWIWIAVIAVVVVVGLAAIVLSRGGQGAAENEIGSEVTVTGDALAAEGAAGAKAPTLAGVSPNGDEVTITPGGGEPTIIFGLAHWCEHCRKEVPRVVAAANDGLFDGVKVYAVSTSQQEDGVNWPPSTWLEQEKWPFPVLADDAEARAARALGLSGFPYILAIDAAGNVVVQTSGEQTADQLRQIVAAAKSGTETVVAPSEERSEASTTTTAP